MGKNKFYLASVFAFLLAVPTVSQAKYGFYPMFSSMKRMAMLDQTSSAGKVLYYGGPVISNAKVYSVYWGPNVDRDTQEGMGTFFSTILNSTYMDWLDGDYSTFKSAVDKRQGTQQHIGRGRYEGAITITPINTKRTFDDVDIQAELQTQINNGKLPKPDDNTLFMIYLPPGVTVTAAGATSCQDFCAYHGFKGSPTISHFYYGVMPDISGACYFGCASAPSSFDSLSSISSHELLESITDPFPTPGNNPAYPQAWNDDQGNEIADLCVGGDGKVTGQSSTYYVQSIWDNRTNTCTTSNWVSP